MEAKGDQNDYRSCRFITNVSSNPLLTTWWLFNFFKSIFMMGGKFSRSFCPSCDVINLKFILFLVRLSTTFFKSNACRRIIPQLKGCSKHSMRFISIEIGLVAVRFPQDLHEPTRSMTIVRWQRLKWVCPRVWQSFARENSFEIIAE